MGMNPQCKTCATLFSKWQICVRILRNCNRNSRLDWENPMTEEEVIKRLGEKVILTDDELTAMLGAVDINNVKSIRGQTLVAQYSLRAAKNSRDVTDAVRRFDVSSAE